MSLKRSPLFVLPVVAAATAANAADMSPVVVPPVVVPVVVPGPITLIQVEGGPVFSPSGIIEATVYERFVEDPYDKFGTIANERGFYLGAAIRRMSPSNVGMQLAVTGTWINGYQVNPGEFGPTGELFSTMRFQTLDIDVGLHPGGDIRTRFFAGIRALHSVDALHLITDVTEVADAQSVARTWMVGSRVGANVDRPIGSSRVSLVADVSASALFGHSSVLLELQDMTVIGDGLYDESGFRMAFNAEAQFGLALHLSETAAFTIGYRAQQWWGLRQATEVQTDDGYWRTYVNVSPNKLVHGPFARFGLTF
ncbi:MAG: Lpg1974 family pore-forming outer membrane protein [Bauldia sp.]